MTPADHAWQNDSPGAADRVFADEDCCGFWLATPDGTVWAPGDSRLIPDHHLTRPAPDALVFDFSDSEWHFGLDGAVPMANAYPDTPLLLHHWGCVDAPDFAPFNGDPQDLRRTGRQPRADPRPRARGAVRPAAEGQVASTQVDSAAATSARRSGTSR